MPKSTWEPIFTPIDGIHTEDDPRLPATVTSANNVEFSRRSTITTRNGYDRIGNEFPFLAKHKERVISYKGGIQVYNAANKKFEAAPNSQYKHKIAEVKKIPVLDSTYLGKVLEIGDYKIVTGYSTELGYSVGLYLIETNQLLSQTSMGAGTYPHLFLANNTAYAFAYDSTDWVLIELDLTDGTWSSPQVVSGIPFVPANSKHVESFSDSSTLAAVSLKDSSGDIRVSVFDVVTLSEVGSDLLYVNTYGTPLLCRGGDDTQMFVSYYDKLGSDYFIYANEINNSGSGVSGGQIYTWDSSAFEYDVELAFVFYNALGLNLSVNQYKGLFTDQKRVIWFTINTTTWTATELINQDHLSFISPIFTFDKDDEQLYVIAAFRPWHIHEVGYLVASYGIPEKYITQGSYFLLAIYYDYNKEKYVFYPAAQMAKNLIDTYQSYSRIVYPFLRSDGSTAVVSLRSEVIDDSKITSSAIYEIDITPEAPTTVEMVDSTLIPGSVPLIYDGTSMKEHGFLSFPETIYVNMFPTSGNEYPLQGPVDGGGFYSYAICYMYTDKNGNEYRSFPGIIVGAQRQTPYDIYVYAAPYLFSVPSDVTVYIEFYRTPEDGQTFYYMTRVKNDPTALLQSVPDNYSDDDLIGNSVLYVDGNELGNAPPPSYKAHCEFQGRHFVVDANNPTWRIVYSKEIKQGTGLSYNEALEIIIPQEGGDITALAEHAGQLVVFKKNAVYSVYGQGLNNTGGGSLYSKPIRRPIGVGALSQNVVAHIEGGLAFVSSTGIYLLDASFNITRISDQVNEYIRVQDYTITNLISDFDKQHLLVSTEEGITLVFSWAFGKWTTWDIDIANKPVFSNTLVFSNSTGTYKMSNDSLLDDGYRINTDIEFGAMSFSQPGGQHWAKSVYINGYVNDGLSPHSFTGTGEAYIYRLDEVQKDTLIQPVDEGPVLQITGTPSIIDGKFGSGRSFGSGSYLYGTDSQDTLALHDFTISFWCYASSSTQAQYASVLSLDYPEAIPNDYAWAIRTLDTTSRLHFTIHTQSDDIFSVTGPYMGGTLGTWYHFTVVYDYDNFEMRWYSFGQHQATTKVTGGDIHLKTEDTRIFSIGATHSDSTKYWNGGVDDVAIYNYALSDAEIGGLSKGLYPLTVSYQHNHDPYWTTISGYELSKFQPYSSSSMYNTDLGAEYIYQAPIIQVPMPIRRGTSHRIKLSTQTPIELSGLTWLVKSDRGGFRNGPPRAP